MQTVHQLFPSFKTKQTVIANFRVYIEYIPLYRTCGAHLNSLAYKSLCVLYKSMFYSLEYSQHDLIFFFRETYYLITFAPDYVILSKKNYKKYPAVMILPFNPVRRGRPCVPKSILKAVVLCVSCLFLSAPKSSFVPFSGFPLPFRTNI